MIEVDEEACSLCQACVGICHTNCIAVTQGRVQVDHNLCSTCCQCIAICPQGALSWNGVKSREIQLEKLPSYESVLELLKARRTIRQFKDKAIEREKLEKICQAAKLAPTNVYDFELIVVTDQCIISQLERIGLEFIRKIDYLLYSFPIIFRLFKAVTPAVNDIDRIKVQNTLKRQSLFHKAPVLILVIADPRIPHAEASCQYAMYNMILMAQTLGLGSCISGAGKLIFSRSKRVRRILNIPQGKNILGVLLVGYPAVHFYRTVEGNYPRMHWIESK